MKLYKMKLSGFWYHFEAELSRKEANFVAAAAAAERLLNVKAILCNAKC